MCITHYIQFTYTRIIIPDAREMHGREVYGFRMLCCCVFIAGFFGKQWRTKTLLFPAKKENNKMETYTLINYLKKPISKSLVLFSTKVQFLSVSSSSSFALRHMQGWAMMTTQKINSSRCVYCVRQRNTHTKSDFLFRATDGSCSSKN